MAVQEGELAPAEAEAFESTRVALDGRVSEAGPLENGVFTGKAFDDDAFRGKTLGAGS